MPENPEGRRNLASGDDEAMVPDDDPSESAYSHRTIKTGDGRRLVGEVCPKCMRAFDYRLDGSVDPVFDGDPARRAVYSLG